MTHRFVARVLLVIGLSPTFVPLSAQIVIAPSPAGYDAAFHRLTHDEQQQVLHRPNMRLKSGRDLIMRVERPTPHAYFREEFFSSVNVSAYVAFIEDRNFTGPSVALTSAKVYGYYVPDIDRLTPVFKVELTFLNSHAVSTMIQGKGIGPPIRLGAFDNVKTDARLAESVNTAVMLAFLRALLAASTHNSGNQVNPTSQP